MRRIFFLSSQSLFGQGLQSLLREEGDVDVVGQEADVDLAIERIKALRPDVVIVDRTDPAIGTASTVAGILTECLGTRVIGVDLEDNTLSIYQGEERGVSGVGDLVRALERSPSSLSSPRDSEHVSGHGQALEPGETEGGRW